VPLYLVALTVLHWPRFQMFLSFTAHILVSSHCTVSSHFTVSSHSTVSSHGTVCQSLYCQQSQYCIRLYLKYLAVTFSNNFFIPRPVMGLVSTFMPTCTLTNAHVTKNIHFGADEGYYDFTGKCYQRKAVFRWIEYL